MNDTDKLDNFKRMFQDNLEREKEKQTDREIRFISDVNKLVMGENSKLSAIQGYEPVNVMEFLETPSGEIQKLLGGEWSEMKPEDFEALVYSMQKKIKKSTYLIDWNNR